MDNFDPDENLPGNRDTHLLWRGLTACGLNYWRVEWLMKKGLITTIQEAVSCHKCQRVIHSGMVKIPETYSNE